MCNNERVTSKWVTNFDGAAQLVDAIRFWQRTQRRRTLVYNMVFALLILNFWVVASASAAAATLLYLTISL